MATFVTVPNKDNETGGRVRHPTREQLKDDGRVDGVPIVMPADFWSAHDKKMLEMTRSHAPNWNGCKVPKRGNMERIAVVGRRAASPHDRIGPFISCAEAGRAVGGHSANVSHASETGKAAYGFYWTRVTK